MFAFNLKQIGIDVEVKYFSARLQEKARHAGEPYDVVFLGWGADYADPGRVLRPAPQTGSRERA